MKSEPGTVAPPFGRSEELGVIERALASVLAGSPELLFVSGEAGLGKSTLLRQFLGSLAQRVESVAVGQCVERFGSTEPYLPLLEALAALCRGSKAAFWRDTLWRLAPSWLVQLPGLVEDDEWEILERRTRTTTPGRMLRELSESLEHGAAHGPVVVLLEDLHWTDAATLAALDYLSQRERLGGVLLLATCRLGNDPSSEAVASFRREACARGRAKELKLEPLAAEAIFELFRVRAHPHPVDPAIARAVCERSRGNPLFASHLLDHVLASSELPSPEQIAGLVPDGLSAIIQNQLARLDPDARRLLGLASLAGVEFLAAPLAFAGELDPVATEQRLQRLASANQFLEAAGSMTFSNGSVSGRYRFRHALYRDALAQALSGAERSDYHGRLASGLRAAYAERASEVAGQLALHCEAAGDKERAVAHMLEAGISANQRAAFVDSVKLLERALSILSELPRSPTLAQRELAVRTAMVPGLLVSAGYGSRELEEHCLGAVKGGALHDPKRLPIVHALRNIYFVRADYARADEWAQRVLDSVLASGDATYMSAALKMTGDSRIFCGAPAEGVKRLDEAIAAYDPARDAGQAFVLGTDTRVSSLAYSALGQWLRGRMGDALARSERALVLAEQIGHPHTLGLAYVLASAVQLRLGEFAAVREHGEALLDLSRDYGLVPFTAWANIRIAQADVYTGDAEALGRLEHWMAARTKTGEALAQSLLLAEFAEAALLVGDLERARDAIDTGIAFATSTGETSFEPELLRLRGELSSREGDRNVSDTRRFATGVFRAALERAKQLGVRGLSLRIALSLARVAPHEGTEVVERCYERLRGHLVGRDVREALELLKSAGLRDRTVDLEPTSTLPASARVTRKQRRFRREGEYWTLVYDGAVARVKDSRGMAHLAELIRSQNREIHALQLAAAGDVPGADGPAVDAQAKAQYRKRLNELRRALDDAERNNDRAETERLNDELEWIRQQLAEAFGLGGRERATGSAVERARVSVTRAIRKAVERIQEVHPSLGEHLHRNVRTGQFCCYDPDQRLGISWRL